LVWRRRGSSHETSRWLGEEEADLERKKANAWGRQSSVHHRPASRQTPPTSNITRLEEEVDDEQQHPYAHKDGGGVAVASHARPIYDPTTTTHCRMREDEGTAPRRVESRRE
jgi:hypothetical protein